MINMQEINDRKYYELLKTIDNVYLQLTYLEKYVRENIEKGNRKKLQELYLDTIYFDEMYNLIISENSNFDDLVVKTIINESNTNYKNHIIEIKNILRMNIMPTKEAFSCAYLLASIVISSKPYMSFEKYEEIREKYIRRINDKNKESVKMFWEGISKKAWNVSDNMSHNISKLRSKLMIV